MCAAPSEPRAATPSSAATGAREQVEHLTLSVGAQRFYAAAAGPVAGPLVLLLHGFPEISYGWRRQIWPLARAGWRVVAPDQRGYGHSSKPPSVAAYALHELADDAIGIARALGHERFHVVGHDWGGIVAWHLAQHRPAHVDKLVILNAPRIGAFSHYLRTHPGQMLMSAYVAAFQLPVLPELALRARGFAALTAALHATSRVGTFSGGDFEVYRRAWAEPGALTGMLNWYRALRLAPPGADARIAAPTLVVWGDRDVALQKGLAEHSAAVCDQARVVHLPDAGHWVQHEAAEEVNALLVDFLST